MKKKRQYGFTLPEVTIALAIVAFGLVAVLGILPIGVTVTRDNKDDTLIKNDAEYWMNAIRGGRLALEALNHAEWVELRVNGQVYRAEYAPLLYDPWPDDPKVWPRFDSADGLPPVAYRGSMKQATWRSDVIGWLSMPDLLTDGTTIEKYAKIRPFGNTMLDRQFGRKGVNTDGEVVYRNEGGDLTFSYLLQSNVRMVGPNFWEIKLTLKWPVVEEGPTADTVKTGAGKRVFVAYINAPNTKAWTRWDLSEDERIIYDSLLPDEPLTEPQVVKFHADENGFGPAQVTDILKTLHDAGLARKPSANSWMPSALYESFGRFSMRRIDDPTPPLYSPMAANDGHFGWFTKPAQYFEHFYFFKPALDD